MPTLECVGLKPDLQARAASQPLGGTSLIGLGVDPGMQEEAGGLGQLAVFAVLFLRGHGL